MTNQIAPVKPGYRLEFQDEFDAPFLDLNKWFPYYLPHWSSRAQSAPDYRLEAGCLVLRITPERQPWCPEFDGGVKCSSIQTGEYAGPVGSAVGQHRFRAACRVREAQEPVQAYVSQYGYFEMRCRAALDANSHFALWMIGYEDAPERSGEIAIFEIMGAHAAAQSTRAGHGVRRWGDPALKDAFYEPFLPFDAAQFHAYALEWTPERLDFFVDGQKINTIQQSPTYPMQFMVSLYELPSPNPSGRTKEFWIDYFRGYQRI